MVAKNLPNNATFSENEPHQNRTPHMTTSRDLQLKTQSDDTIVKPITDNAPLMRRCFDDLAARIENCREVSQREIQKTRSDLSLVKAEISDLSDQISQTNARLTFLVLVLFVLGIVAFAILCLSWFPG